MSQVTDFSQLSQNIPLVLIGLFLFYMLVKSIINRTGYRHQKHDIDTMIRKSTLRFQADYGGQTGEEQGPTVKEQLKALDDTVIKELLNAMEWGDKFNFPILITPFSRVAQRTLFQYKRILGLRKKITFHQAEDFFNFMEEQINFYYLENPLEDFPKDDILSATNLLGVRQDDTPEKIKKRYHALSKKYHPDTFNHDDLNEQQRENLDRNYKLIQKAYAILSEREKL